MTRIAPSVHAALIAVQVMFASMASVGKIVLRELPPSALVAVRAPVAALLLLGLRALMPPWERVAPRDLAVLALHAFFGIAANQLLFMLGLERSTATNAVVIGATIPVFTVGVAVALRRETATAAKIVGLVVACLGALVIVGADRFETGGRYLGGNLLILVNSLSFAIYLVISRPILERYRPLTVITWTMALGGAMLVPFGAAPLAAKAAQVSATAWLALAYVILFPTVGTYFLNAWALRRAPSSVVAIYIYLQPVMGALIAAALLGERPTASVAAGGALIAVGIWLVTLRR